MTKVSMQGIAESVGVSKYAVSLALRGKEGISEETRNKILDAARSMGYIYKNGQHKKEGIKNICIIVSRYVQYSTEFYGRVQYGIEMEARKHNINCFIFCYDENSDKYELPDSIKDGFADGIICIGRIDENYFEEIQKYNIPTVLTDHYFEDINIDCILSDNIKGAYEATMHLVKEGHKEIAFLGDILWAPSFLERWLGYIKAMRKAGLPYSSEYYTVVEDILKKAEKRPTAVVCSSDPEAIRLIKYLQSKGLRIPEDYSIVGFDNISSASTLTPELTTINVPKEEMGKKALQRLLYIAENSKEDKHKILVETELIVRKSTAKV